MKAAQINAYGGPEAFHFDDDLTEPTPGPNEVQVAVRAASINPFDLAVLHGLMQKMIPLQFPAVLGLDFAGVITATGTGVRSFAIGDEVYGQGSPFKGHGSWASMSIADSGKIAKKPTATDFSEAASLPLVAVSAYQALVEHLQLKSGQTILIHGGVGGIGSMAIQLAKHLGAHIITTVGTKDMALATSLGAEEVVDYQTQAFEKEVHDVDAVFDTVGGETNAKSYQVLKKGGTIVAMIAKPDAELMAKFGVQAIAQVTQVNTNRLIKVAELVDQGVIKPQVTAVFPLEKIADAVRQMETGPRRGKTVLTVE